VLLGVVLAKALALRRVRPQTGEEELVGDVAVVRQALDPEGLVFVHGELWRARVTSGSAGPGDEVRVVAIDDGLVLEVAPLEARTEVPA
jgi:membrane-bound serine protease (ClpP class)